ncbi:MAG: hypothetical protein CME06_15255 [Gemmatimonadetes bacterium]|nr:hypothetical protein [Gemmatimonadota bacterium]
MTTQQSTDIIVEELRGRISTADLHRSARVDRYDPGDELVYDAEAVIGAERGGSGTIRLVVERFVGGGFAGQVYKVRVLDVAGGEIDGISPGSSYAIKILIPPSGGALLFRNVLYGIGFQGPFQLQSNPAAARSGALWQKFIRRGASIGLAEEGAVNDIHATFIDTTLGSCGELSDWVDGRTWRLEVDEHLDYLKRWRQGKPVPPEKLGSDEYRAKKVFMAEFVTLLHEMGAHEFARQYEWSTCKSQPNCLKRSDTEGDPAAGLLAVDFRAGLALLPFLPMSPGDLKLIVLGLFRGSLVQFDRGNIDELESFVDRHSDRFADMRPLLEDLREADEIYRDSVPDVTHNRLRLLYDRKLWDTLLDRSRRGWRIRNIIDDDCLENLEKSFFLTLFFRVLGLIPILGGFIRRLWGRDDLRRHYRGILTSREYLRRAIRAKIAESILPWHRAGRVRPDRALALAKSPPMFLLHLPLSILPVGIHRFLTDRDYFRERLRYIFIRPVRLYFDAAMREEWLFTMVEEGEAKHIIDHEEAAIIRSRIKDPFIQKYLKSLAVHVCTVPITQVVSVLVALIYVWTHPEMPRAQAWAVGAGIIALFQVVPISPGSLVRGLYVVYLVIRERNFKDYNIAVFLGFFKYIGYLAFPIQMAQRYPTLARFMAGHWATEAVHVVPVFGEGGALLEHWIFRLFYNWPLTIRRRARQRMQRRSMSSPRYWHIAALAIGAAAVFGAADFSYVASNRTLPELGDLVHLVLLLPLICGWGTTIAAGGAPMGRRILGASLCGLGVGLLYTAASVFAGSSGGVPIESAAIMSSVVWRVFLFSIIATVGAIATEIVLGE